MIIGVPKETFPGERRVALSASAIPNLVKAGMEVLVEAGAGVSAGYPDAEYAAKGAKIVAKRSDVFSAADVVLQVLCYGSNDRTGKDDLPLLQMCIRDSVYHVAAQAHQCRVFVVQIQRHRSHFESDTNPVVVIVVVIASLCRQALHHRCEQQHRTEYPGRKYPSLNPVHVVPPIAIAW